MSISASIPDCLGPACLGWACRSDFGPKMDPAGGDPAGLSPTRFNVKPKPTKV